MAKEKRSLMFTYTGVSLTHGAARKLVKAIHEIPEVYDFFLGFLEGPEAEVARQRFGRKPLEERIGLLNGFLSMKKVRENAGLTALLEEINAAFTLTDLELERTGDLGTIIQDVEKVADLVKRLFALEARLTNREQAQSTLS